MHPVRGVAVQKGLEAVVFEERRPYGFKGSENGCGHTFNAKSGRDAPIRESLELGERGDRRFVENVQATSLNSRSKLHSPRPNVLTNDNVDHASTKVEIHENSAEFLQLRLFPRFLRWILAVDVVGPLEFNFVGPFSGCIDGATCVSYGNCKEILDEHQVRSPDRAIRGCACGILDGYAESERQDHASGR